MEPAIEAVAAETDVAVAKVDVDVNQALAGELGVRGVPTVVLFVDGEQAERLVGAQDQATLERLVGSAQ
jgi:thioredoxin 1